MRGISLGELIRARRVRYLLNLIDHLPRDSHFHDAQSRDRELALEIYLDDDGNDADGGQRRPRQTDMSYTNELLTELCNEIKGLRSEVHGYASGKAPPKTRWVLMPARAIDDIRDEMDTARIDLMSAMMTPPAQHPGEKPSAVDQSAVDQSRMDGRG